MIEIRSLRDLARLFFIFREEFRLAVTATIVVAVLGCFLLPSRYQSEARLLVNPGRETSTLPIELQDRASLVAPSTQRDPIVDEEMMLTGRPIVHDVAAFYIDQIANAPRQPGLWNAVRYYSRRAGNAALDGVRGVLSFLGIVDPQTPVERLAGKLEKSFKVVHAPGSSVMDVSFTWNDPAIAQKVVDRWVATYLDQRTKALARKSLYEFYEGQARAVGAQIADDKQKLRDYLLNVDGVSSKDRLESLGTRINTVIAERGEADAEYEAIQHGIGTAKQTIGGQPAEVVQNREVTLNPNWLNLQLKMHDLEMARLEKLRTFQDDAPPVQETDAEIEHLRQRIAAEHETLQRSESLAPNQISTGLQKGIADDTVRASELKARIAAYDAELESLRQERRRILSVEPELSLLEENLSVAEKNYAQYLDSLEKARIDRELDNSRINNIAIIQQASFSPARVFPKRLLVLLLALPTGLAVGAFVIYLCYLLDLRIHDGGGVASRFGVPLWTTIPDKAAADTLPIAFDASVHRLLGQLPFNLLQERGLTIGIASSCEGEGVSFIATQLIRVLAERGISARLAEGDSDRAMAGTVVVVEAPALPGNPGGFTRLKTVDLRLLVIEARRTTIPVVENTLAVLRTAFGRIDGIIVNRRRYEIPSAVLQKAARWTGVAQAG